MPALWSMQASVKNCNSSENATASHADLLGLVMHSSPRASARRTGHFRSLVVSVCFERTNQCLSTVKQIANNKLCDNRSRHPRSILRETIHNNYSSYIWYSVIHSYGRNSSTKWFSDLDRHRRCHIFVEWPLHLNSLLQEICNLRALRWELKENYGKEA